jgi:hypothetical protein
MHACMRAGHGVRWTEEEDEKTRQEHYPLGCTHSRLAAGPQRPGPGFSTVPVPTSD